MSSEVNSEKKQKTTGLNARLALDTRRADGKRSSLIQLTVGINNRLLPVRLFQAETMRGQRVILNALTATVTSLSDAMPFADAIASACAVYFPGRWSATLQNEKPGVKHWSPESPHSTQITGRPRPTVGVLWVVYIYTYSTTHIDTSILYYMLHCMPLCLSLA